MMSNFDNMLKPIHDHVAGHHKLASSSRDQGMVINELLNHAQVFTENQNRSHHYFKLLTTIFMELNKKRLENWIKDNIQILKQD